MIYNKVEDIYHTSLRISSYLESSNTSWIDIKSLMLIDFLICFPQYAAGISTKRGLSFLKQKEFPTYKGSMRSHLFLLEKSHWGAYRLLQAKSIIFVDGDSVTHLKSLKTEQFIQLTKIDAQVIKYIIENGIQSINKHLNLFENRYESKA
jgi:hypothetical protein